MFLVLELSKRERFKGLPGQLKKQIVVRKLEYSGCTCTRVKCVVSKDSYNSTNCKWSIVDLGIMYTDLDNNDIFK